MPALRSLRWSVEAAWPSFAELLDSKSGEQSCSHPLGRSGARDGSVRVVLTHRTGSISRSRSNTCGGLDWMTHRGPFQPLTFCELGRSQLITEDLQLEMGERVLLPISCACSPSKALVNPPPGCARLQVHQGSKSHSAKELKCSLKNY